MKFRFTARRTATEEPLDEYIVVAQNRDVGREAALEQAVVDYGVGVTISPEWAVVFSDVTPEIQA